MHSAISIVSASSDNAASQWARNNNDQAFQSRSRVIDESGDLVLNSRFTQQQINNLLIEASRHVGLTLASNEVQGSHDRFASVAPANRHVVRIRQLPTTQPDLAKTSAEYDLHVMNTVEHDALR